MTPLDIFIFVSFTILVLALKNFYEKYEAAQDLLEAFAHEIEERVSQNKSFQDKIVELNYTLDAKLQEYKSEKLLLEQQFVSQIKDLKNDVNNLIVDLEKKK